MTPSWSQKDADRLEVLAVAPELSDAELEEANELLGRFERFLQTGDHQ